MHWLDREADSYGGPERRSPRRPRWYQARAFYRLLAGIAIAAGGIVAGRYATEWLKFKPVSQEEFAAEVAARKAFENWVVDSVADRLLRIEALECVSARRTDPKGFNDLRQAARVQCTP